MKKFIVGTAIISILMLAIYGCTIRNNLVSSVPSSKFQKQLTEKEKLDDFEYMYKILKDNYPFFEVNKRVYGVDWLSKKNEYIKRIKSTKSDDDFFISMNNILGELHNGHTHMYNQQQYSYWKKLILDWESGNEAWLSQFNDKKALLRYSQKDISEGPNLDMTQINANIGVNSNKALNLVGVKGEIAIGSSKDNVKTKILENGKTAYLKVKGFDYYNIDSDATVKGYL